MEFKELIQREVLLAEHRLEDRIVTSLAVMHLSRKAVLDDDHQERILAIIKELEAM